MSFIRFFMIVAIISFGLTTVNAGQGGGHGKGHSASHSSGHGKGHSVGKKSSHSASHANKANKSVKKTAVSKNSNRFSTTDRSKIKEYFDKNPSEKALPPGIAMNVARGKPLPPGIAKRNLPSDLASTLPARPGYEYLLVGKDAVLVNENTQIVSDIISNVLK